MSNQISDLSRSALEVIQQLFLSIFNRSISTKFVEFSLDVGQSELIITSKEESDDGEVGIYSGLFRWPYLKANLSTVLPHPLAVEIQYPLTFRQLRAQLLTRYQIHFEEGELSLTLGGEGLVDDSMIVTPLINQYGQFNMYATESSARFVEGSKLSLIFLQPGRRVPLRALLDIEAPGALGVLAGT